MKNLRTRISTLALIFILILSTSNIFAETIDLDEIQSMSEVIKSNYLYEVDNEELTIGAIKGLFSVLDPYSNYYTKEEYEKLTQDLTGEIKQSGIGVRIIQQEGKTIIVETITNNPAEKSGLKAGDIIVEVGDSDIEYMPLQDVTDLIRGQTGSEVKIGVKRKDTGKILYYNVERQPIVINPVQYKVVDGDIGYIKINEFNNNAVAGYNEALIELEARNIDKIIFDLRDNPGGYLLAVKNMLQEIIPEGPLYHTRDGQGKTITTSSYNKQPRQYKQIVVAINENSASASEIFAGAIQDRNIGTIIGTKTFGKGTVQNIMPLTNGGAIKLTVAEYFTPNKNKVNNVGITPDIITDNFDPLYIMKQLVPQM